MKKTPFVYMEFDEMPNAFETAEAIDFASEELVYLNRKLSMKIAMVVSVCEDDHCYVGATKDGFKNRELYLEKIEEISKPHNPTNPCPCSSVLYSYSRKISIRKYRFFRELFTELYIIKLRLTQRKKKGSR